MVKALICRVRASARVDLDETAETARACDETVQKSVDKGIIEVPYLQLKQTRVRRKIKHIFLSLTEISRRAEGSGAHNGRRCGGAENGGKTERSADSRDHRNSPGEILLHIALQHGFNSLHLLLPRCRCLERSRSLTGRRSGSHAIQVCRCPCVYARRLRQCTVFLGNLVLHSINQVFESHAKDLYAG